MLPSIISWYAVNTSAYRMGRNSCTSPLLLKSSLNHLFLKLFITLPILFGIIDDITMAWSSLVEGDEGCIGPSAKLLCI